MKGKMFSKSKLVAILCCLCLAVTSLISATLLFNKNEKVFADAGNVGYYVQDGASVRFDNRISGLRYETVVTKEQYDAWTASYGSDATYEFHTVISYATPGEEAQDVIATNDIKLHDFDEGDFVYKGAIFFDLTDNGNGEDWTDEELFEIYNAQYKAESYVLINGQKVDADNADNLRSMRSVALLNRIKETTSDAGELALLKEFTQNVVSGELVALDDSDFVTDDKAYYYNNYADTSKGIAFDLQSALPEGQVNGYVGANAVPETDFILNEDRDSISVKNVKKYLNVGESEYFIMDALNINKVFVLSNVVDATEVFYPENGVERLREVFTLTASEIFVNSKITKDVLLDEEDEEVSCEFYNVDRGYYVLGGDIDFGEGQYIVHDTSMNFSKNYYDESTKDIPEGFYRSETVQGMSGQFGFGGTFNGNGYKIIGFGATSAGGTVHTRASGLFGALAYGAKIENVAFTDIRYGASRGSSDKGSHAVLATWAGNNNASSYLTAKYKEEPAIVIDNCFFSSNEESYTMADVGTNTAINNAKSPAGRGLIIQTAEGVSKFSNCVFQTYNSDPMGVYQTSTSLDGGYGIIADKTSLFDDNYENCYMISAPKANGRVEPVFQYVSPWVYNYNSEEYVELGYGTVGNASGAISAGVTYDKTAHPFIYKPDTSKIIYAANDYAELGLSSTGTEVYTGVDGEGKSVVAIPDGENGYTANKTAYAYTNIYRYDNYLDMIINNTASVSGFNSDFWNVSGGAVIWKGVENADDYVQTTLDISYPDSVSVGEPVQLTVFALGQDVTEQVTILAGEGYTVDNVNKTVTLTQSSTVTVTVTAGNLTGSESITPTIDYNTALVMSSAYSAIKGKTETYSVPYKYVDGNLVATDLVEIYKQATNNNSATLNGAYAMEDGKQTLDIVTVEDKKYVAVSDPGKTPTIKVIALQGSHGVILLNNNTVVTGVIEDADGFRYIPSSTESRKGSYYLATDFDNRLVTDGWSETNPAHSKLSDAGIYNGSSIFAIGYSFGSTTNGWPNAASINADNGDAFHGLFDGLGHKISYLVGQGGGLLGIYESYTEVAPIIKNVHFENYYANRFFADGTTQECTIEGEYAGQILKNVDYFVGQTNHGVPIFAGIEGDGFMDVSEDCTIRLESVVFEIKNLKTFVGSDRYGFFQIDYDEGNPSTYLSDRISLNNVVIEYNDASGNTGINDTQGQMRYGEGAGFLFDGHRMAYTGNTIYNISKYQMQGVNNVYMIVKPSANGRVASVTGGFVSGAGQIVALAENDFDALIPNANVYDGFMNGETPVSYGFTIKTTATSAPTSNNVAYGYGTYGWGVNSSGRFEIVSTLDVEGFTYELASGRNANLTAGVSPTIFFAYQGVNRYDDYNALVTAKGGTATVGNWSITSSGITWSPVA